jgi:hypothetical protein
MDEEYFDFRQEEEIFLSSETSRSNMGPTSSVSKGITGSFARGTKFSVREVGHLPLSTAEFSSA